MSRISIHLTVASASLVGLALVTQASGFGTAFQRDERPTLTTYVKVQHRPGVWVRARVDRQWRHQGVWKVAVYYYLDTLQYFRVIPADDCRPPSA